MSKTGNGCTGHGGAKHTERVKELESMIHRCNMLATAVRILSDELKSKGYTTEAIRELLRCGTRHT